MWNIYVHTNLILKVDIAFGFIKGYTNNKTNFDEIREKKTQYFSGVCGIN